MSAIAIFLALAVLRAPDGVSGAAPPQGELSVTYQVESTVTLREPVVVTVTVENSTDAPVAIDLGLDRTANFRFEPRGAIQPRRRVVDEGAGGVVRAGTLAIAPGQRYQQRLLLNEWFEFDRIGIYEIYIRLDSPLSGDARATASAAYTGSTLRFEVLPRNERVLRETCAKLSAIVSATRDVDVSFQAARELAAVKDPIAVEYIGQALAATSRGEFILIPALVGIGGREAKALAERLSHDADSERAGLARNAVARLK